MAYVSVLPQMQAIIVRTPKNSRPADPRLKSSILQQHLAPVAFDYFHLQELEKVQNAHPTLGNGLTQYFVEMRVWELYFGRDIPFIGKHPHSTGTSANNHISTSATPSHAPPTPQSPSPSSSKTETETITLPLSEYGNQLRAQFEAGKQEGTRLQEQKYGHLEEELRSMVLETQKITQEALDEVKKEREYDLAMRQQFDAYEAGKQEGLRSQEGIYKEYAYIAENMKELVLETRQMTDEVLENAEREGGKVEHVRKVENKRDSSRC